MGFKIVPRSTERIDMGDGDFIEVKKGLTKGDFRKVLSRLPEDFDNENTTFKPAEAEDFTTGIFDALVVGWSAVDPDSGEPLSPTTENYLTRLDRETATAVDLALFEYFNGLNLSEADAKKSGKTGR